MRQAAAFSPNVLDEACNRDQEGTFRPKAMNAEELAHEALDWIVRPEADIAVDNMRRDVIAYFKRPKGVDPHRDRGKPSLSGQIIFNAMRTYFEVLAQRLTRERVRPREVDLRYIRLRRGDHLLTGVQAIAEHLRRTVEDTLAIIAADATIPVSLHSGILVALKGSLGPWRARALSPTRRDRARKGAELEGSPNSRPESPDCSCVSPLFTVILGMRSAKKLLTINQWSILMLSYRLPERLCYTIEEAVAASGVSRRSIYRAMDDQALKFSFIAGRRRIMCSDLVEWLKSGRCAAEPVAADSVAPAAQENKS